MGKALILCADGFEDSELLVPRYRLLEAGWKVDVAAPKKGVVTGKYGIPVEANLTITDVKPAGYDLLILPGGKGPETVRLEKGALDAVKMFFKENKPVAAICHGPQILISAGVLRGRRATSWIGIRDDLIAAGANYSDDEVVVDGNLITSRQPTDLPAFLREIMKAVVAPVGV